MITLKFPSLEKGLQKGLKDVPADDPRNGISILDNHAILYQDDFCFVVNLKDYFMLECGIEHDDDVKDLENILYYMDGKSFNSDSWKELTKGSNMEMRNGSLFVENPKFSKDLHYENTSVNLYKVLKNLKKTKNENEDLLSAVACPFFALKNIYDCLSSDFKKDVLILEFSGQDRLIRFTFQKRKHCFGYIVPHYDAVQEGFRFDSLENFVESPEFDFAFEENKNKAVAPPPPSDENQEESDDDNDDNSPKLNFDEE